MKKELNREYLIIGGGITGLAFASKLNNSSYVILEKEERCGGYCKTFFEKDFVWDYAGHFFHFNEPELQKEFSPLLCDPASVYSEKNTKIYYKGQYVDYPFQFNIHQLPKEEFLDCLCDLFEKDKHTDNEGFKGMLYSKFGTAISEKFLIPYNEKLYSCDLNDLDVDAMGRFFPNADAAKIVQSFRGERIKTYNDSFFYSSKGAEAFVTHFMQSIPDENLLLSQEVQSVDTENKIAYTKDYAIHYDKLINTMPFDALLRTCGIEHKEEYTSNRVLVFNIGFDRKAVDNKVHWIYYPDKALTFYRVGFYNNILGDEKLSIYVEIGLNREGEVDTEKLYQNTLCDLEKVGIITDHKVEAYNTLLMDPAYVHISHDSQAEKEKIKKELANKDIYTLGRYGNWTYCSIEDCISSAYGLFGKLEGEDE